MQPGWANDIWSTHEVIVRSPDSLRNLLALYVEFSRAHATVKQYIRDSKSGSKNLARFPPLVLFVMRQLTERRYSQAFKIIEYTGSF